MHEQQTIVMPCQNCILSVKWYYKIFTCKCLLNICNIMIYSLSSLSLVSPLTHTKNPLFLRFPRVCSLHYFVRKTNIPVRNSEEGIVPGIWRKNNYLSFRLSILTMLSSSFESQKSLFWIVMRNIIFNIYNVIIFKSWQIKYNLANQEWDNKSHYQARHGQWYWCTWKCALCLSYPFRNTLLFMLSNKDGF